MATIQYAYPLDNNGTAATNKVTAELHTVTAVNNRNYHYLIPTFAPFFANSVKLFKRVGQNLTPLVENVDWQPAAQFMGASTVTAKPVYGAISLLDISYTGQIEIGEYQTLGGEYTLDVEKMTQVIADIVFNPRGASWEQITNLQKMFPPLDHPWDFADMVGQTEVVEALNAIHDAIMAGHGLSLEDHLRDFDNPHRTNKNQVGLPLVENFGPANSITAIQGISNDSLITPMTLRAVLDNLGLLNLAELIDLFQRHIADRQDPHDTTQAQVDLALVENLPVATPTDILGKRKVRKYLTLEGLIDYLALHGCQPLGEQPETFPPKDSLLSSYCDGTRKMGVYADGNGSSYEKVMEINSAQCGYLPPPSLPDHPPNGQLLSKYCDGFNQYGVYANGYGGSYSRLISINSTDCGYTGAPPPPGSTHPPSGTILSTRCEGTTKVIVKANGAGGSFDERETNSPNCTGGEQHPPAGQLIDTACQGLDLQGKYTDGSGGFYFNIIELNSSRCAPAPTGSPPSTTPNPGVTITQNKLSLDPNQTVALAYNAYSMDNSTQYRVTFMKRLPNQDDTFNQPVPGGEFIVQGPAGTYSNVFNYTYTDPVNNAGTWMFSAKIEKLSDATKKGVSNLLTLELRAANTPPTTPPSTQRPNASISFDTNSISVGQTTTMRMSFTNLVPGKSYLVTGHRKNVNASGFSAFTPSGSFVAQGTSYSNSTSIANNGDMLNGAASYKALIAEETNPSNSNESSAVNLNFTSNKSIRLLLDNSPGMLSIINGYMVNVSVAFTGFPITGRAQGDGMIRWRVKASGADTRVIEAQPIATNAAGNATFQFDNQLVQSHVRGNASYQIEATWTDASGAEQTVLSNSVAVVWFSVDGGGGNPPTPTTPVPVPTTPTPTTPNPPPGNTTGSCETVHVRSGVNLTGTAVAAGTGFNGQARYQVSGKISPTTPSRSQLTIISVPNSEPYGRALFCTPSATEAAINSPVNQGTHGGMWGYWQSRNISDNLQFFSYVLSEVLAPYGLSGQFIVDPTGSRNLDAQGNFTFMAVAQTGNNTGAGA